LSSYFHGALYQIVLFAEYAVYFAAGWVFGLFSSPTDYYVSYLADPIPHFLLARGTAVAAALGVVWLSHAIASRVYNPRVGLAAAIFAAFSLLPFQMSFLALADMPATFLLMAATYLAVRSVEEPGEHGYFCASAVFVGLAAATKYHAGLGIVIVLVAGGLKAASQARPVTLSVRLAILGSVLAGVGFCAGIPQVLADPLHLYDDVFRRLGGQYAGYDPAGNAWLFLVTNHLRNGLGIPLAVASVVGAGFAIYKRSHPDLLLLAFPVGLYLLLMQSVGFAYHFLPAVPFLLILAARWLDAVASAVVPRRRLTATLAAAALVVGPTLLDCVRLVSVMGSPSTKTLAKAWIETHVPAGATIMSEGYVFTAPAFGPPIAESRSTLERDVAFVKQNSGTARTAVLRLAYYDRLQGGGPTYDILKVREMDADAISREAPAYLVTTSDRDRLAGDELAVMFTPVGYGKARAGVKARIAQDYIVVGAIVPAQVFTPMFPHLMDEDYRAIRRWPVFAGGGSRGPAITIWARRNEG